MTPLPPPPPFGLIFSAGCSRNRLSLDGVHYLGRTQGGSSASASTDESGGSRRLGWWEGSGGVIQSLPSVVFHAVSGSKPRRARTHTHTHAPHTDLIKFISYDLKNIFFLLCLHKKQLFPVYCKVFFTDTQVTRGARLVLY